MRGGSTQAGNTQGRRAPRTPSTRLRPLLFATRAVEKQTDACDASDSDSPQSSRARAILGAENQQWGRVSRRAAEERRAFSRSCAAQSLHIGWSILVSSLTMSHRRARAWTRWSKDGAREEGPAGWEPREAAEAAGGRPPCWDCAAGPPCIT